MSDQLDTPQFPIFLLGDLESRNTKCLQKINGGLHIDAFLFQCSGTASQAAVQESRTVCQLLAGEQG